MYRILCLFLLGITVVWGRLVPHTPCPKLFNYFESESFEIFGAMTFDNDFSGHYKLEVEMSIATNTDKNIRVVRRTPDYRIQNGGNIEYYVLFPFNHTFPKLTKVKFQGRLKCVGPPEEGQEVTPLKAENEVTLELLPDLTTSKPKPPPRPQNPSVPGVTINVFPNDAECGRNIDNTPLVVGGLPTRSGEFPWLAAIFQNIDEKYTFRCAGTLVSKLHIVTAAHCVKDKGVLVNKKSLVLVLGKHNIRFWPIGSQIKSASRLYVHPDYKSPSDADIAIITLDSPVEYTTTVKPACVWDENTDVERITNQNGTVAGWGRDEHGNEYVDEARQIDLAVVDAFDCIKQDNRFSAFTSRNTFCAGNGRGAVPCTGDSGGAFIMKRPNGKFYIRGIVSATIKEGAEPCDVTKNTVFSDVGKYSTWMKNIVNEDL